VKRILSALGGLVAGGLLAASGLFGASSSTEDPAPHSETLQLGAYCRELYGDDATIYMPNDPGDWRCSVWRNGVWGLEPIDVNEACRWQRGKNARLERQDTSERALACTI
jgi:hypothetical protein